MSYNDKNIFAKILNGDAECVKVLENDFILAFMDVMPQAPGHTLVIPKYKTEDLINLDSNYFPYILEATQKIARSIKKVYSPSGVMILQLNGAEAGQSVFHLHFHIMQRSEEAHLLRTSHAKSPSRGTTTKPLRLSANRFVLEVCTCLKKVYRLDETQGPRSRGTNNNIY